MLLKWNSGVLLMTFYYFNCVFSQMNYELPNKDAPPGHCISSEFGLIEVGKQHASEGCMEITCFEDGSVKTIGCVPVVLEQVPGCTLVDEPSLKHPGCCPWLDCSDLDEDD